VVERTAAKAPRQDRRDDETLWSRRSANGALTRRDTLVIAVRRRKPRWRLQPLRPSPKRERAPRNVGFGDLKYPADFKHFRLRQSGCPKGGTFSHSGPQRQFNRISSPSTRSSARFSPRRRRHGVENLFADADGLPDLTTMHDEPDAL